MDLVFIFNRFHNQSAYVMAEEADVRGWEAAEKQMEADQEDDASTGC